MRGFGTVHGTCTKGRVRTVWREVWGAGDGTQCHGTSTAMSEAWAVALGAPLVLAGASEGTMFHGIVVPHSPGLATHHRVVP